MVQIDTLVYSICTPIDTHPFPELHSTKFQALANVLGHREISRKLYIGALR